MQDTVPDSYPGRMGIPDPAFLLPSNPILAQIHMTEGCQIGCPKKDWEAVSIRLQMGTRNHVININHSYL